MKVSVEKDGTITVDLGGPGDDEDWIKLIDNGAARERDLEAIDAALKRVKKPKKGKGNESSPAVS